MLGGASAPRSPHRRCGGEAHGEEERLEICNIGPMYGCCGFQQHQHHHYHQKQNIGQKSLPLLLLLVTATVTLPEVIRVRIHRRAASRSYPKLSLLSQH